MHYTSEQPRKNPANLFAGRFYASVFAKHFLNSIYTNIGIADSTIRGTTKPPSAPVIASDSNNSGHQTSGRSSNPKKSDAPIPSAKPSDFFFPITALITVYSNIKAALTTVPAVE